MANFKLHVSVVLSHTIPIEADTPEEAQVKIEKYVTRKGFNGEMRKYGKFNMMKVSAFEQTRMHNRYTGPTTVQKFLAWYEKLPEGTEFTYHDIMRALNTDKITRANYVIKNAPATREILAGDLVGKKGHCNLYRKGSVAA